MKNYIIFIIGILFVLSSLAFSQQDSLVDVFPLSVGNHWVYEYNAKTDYEYCISNRYSGNSYIDIISRNSLGDSIKWNFREIQNLVNHYHSCVSIPTDTIYSILDTTFYTIIENLEGKHLIYRETGNSFDIWRSIFPFARSLNNPKKIFRYSSIDSTGNLLVETTDTTYEWLPSYLSFWFIPGKGVDSIYCEMRYDWEFRLAEHKLIEATILSVKEPPGKFPQSFSLNQNYPNPFNPSTVISYQLNKRSHVSLKIVNTLGVEIATLVNSIEDAGFKTIQWDATGFPSGVYFYKLIAGENIEVKKLIVMK